jgi:hypothetical protein
MADNLAYSATRRRRAFLNSLYEELLEAAIGYFLPQAQLGREGSTTEDESPIRWITDEPEVQFDWLGCRYSVGIGRELSEQEMRLLKRIITVLSARYELVSDQSLAVRSTQLFRGVPEDRYVSAFLDPSPHTSAVAVTTMPDRIANAIEVLRTSSMTTYENRRIATGVLLFGSHPDSCHEPPVRTEGALEYAHSLTAIRSFHRLCDGLQTLALVDLSGRLVELVDVQEWAQPYAGLPLPVPAATRYRSHSQATLCGGHVCLILTPSGEIKIFGDGVQLFRFLDGKWRLTDAVHKYERWRDSVGRDDIAERVFSVALNLAEDRRGALFVVLDDPELAPHLVAPNDMLNLQTGDDSGNSAKNQLHYLLRGKSLGDLPRTVLENIARIDGAVVLDKNANLLAFGAILRHSPGLEMDRAAEGGRTTAAMAASKFGAALKVSEDGLLSYFRDGECVWDI